MVTKKKVLAVIPARLGSTRFPEKVIRNVRGKPLVQYAYEAACSCSLIDKTIVAVDDPKVQKIVESFGGEAVMTSQLHPSGSDRVFEAAQKFQYEIVLNLQADEPLITPVLVEKLTQPLLQDEQVAMSTLVTNLDENCLDDPNYVKVVVDRNGDALYFSRSAIPYLRNKNSDQRPFWLKHIGLYGYKYRTLEMYTSLAPSYLEKCESLEQLRILEHGVKIRTVLVKNVKLISIDTKEDFDRLEAYLKKES